ncbi:MAG: dihydroxy-acid dehydratase, partial [Thermoplasmatota archaeon]
TRGPCVGHVEPEAYLGGTLGLVRDGDMIEIDVPKRKLWLHVDDEELDRRREKIRPLERELTPFLKRYRDSVIGRNIEHGKVK